MNFLRKNFLIILVLAIGFALRLWGMDFGLPYALHQDEPIIVNHAVAYGSGDLNPHFFIIPPLASYILFLIYGIYYLAGSLSGAFTGVEGFALKFFSDPSSFYLIARAALGLIPGAVSVLLTYFVYKRLFSREGAIYAALIMAVAFLCVVNSHYAYVDNLMLALVLAVYLACMRMMERPSVLNYAAAGILLGLAVSVKYNSALLAAPFVAAHISALVRNKPLKGKVPLNVLPSGGKVPLNALFLGAIFLAGLVFAATNPFSVLDGKFFLMSVTGKIRSRYMGWSHHLSYSLYEGIGPGIFLFAFIGWAAILFREKLYKKVFLFSFPALFYLHLVLRSQRFSRYALPLVPFAVMGAAYLVFKVIMPNAKTRFQKALVLGLSALLLTPTAVKSVKADMLFAGDDTRVVSARWIEENIPARSAIAVDHTAYRPAISQTEDQIRRKEALSAAEAGLESHKKKKIEYMAKAASAREKTYNVYFIGGPRGDEVQFLSMAPVVTGDIESMKKEGIEYVVVNYNNRTVQDSFVRELENKGEIVAVFSPYNDGRIGPPEDSVDNTFMSVASGEIFSRQSTGPVLAVFRLDRD